MLDSSCRKAAVTVTPFAKGCTPELEETWRITERLTHEPIDAILPCASTGEFVKLSRDDRFNVLSAAARANKGQKRMIAGACDASADAVISCLEFAASQAYDACVVCPPYYFGQTQEAVVRFYREVCAAVRSMPVIAYHVPFFTTGIELSTFRELLEIPNLIGMKDSSANMKRIAHLCDIAARERPGFLLFTGTDDCLLPALCAGCAGSMTALAASLPKQIASIYDAFDKGDIRLAMKLQRGILPIIREADSHGFPTGYKLLAKAAGAQIDEAFTQAELSSYERLLRQIKAFNFNI